MNTKYVVACVNYLSDTLLTLQCLEYIVNKLYMNTKYVVACVNYLSDTLLTLQCLEYIVNKLT